MLAGIDHLVIAVEELALAAGSYERLGFTVVPGGRHPEGTHNALIALADGAYIELLAFYAPSPAHRWWSALAQGGGLIDFALASTDLRADAAALRRAGVDIGDPEPGARARPDGYQLRWVLAKPRGPHRGVAPFLIHDETPREERVPRDSGHANHITGIGSVVVAVADPVAVGDWYRGALGQPGRPISRPDLEARGLRFAVGRHWVDLVAPQASRGPIAERLAARGEGPFAATLVPATPGPAASGKEALDPTLTHGARLVLESAPA